MTSSPTATVTVTETVAPSAGASQIEEPVAQAHEPSIGGSALAIGETRDGMDVDTTLIRLTDNARHPSNPYIAPEAGLRWLVIDVKQCLREGAKPTIVGAYNFQAVDDEGGAYDPSGSSWDDWPPLPQFPSEATLQPGECATGSVLLNLREAARITKIRLGDFLSSGSVSAEWVTR